MTRLKLTLFGLVLTGLGAMAARADAPKSLCLPEEKEVFVCQFDSNQKVASLCLAGDRVTYRFGVPGTIELEFPDKGVAPGAAFKFGRDRGGAYIDNHLAFTNKETTYTVDDYENGKEDDNKASIDIDYFSGKGAKRKKKHLSMACAYHAGNWDLLDKLFPTKDN